MSVWITHVKAYAKQHNVNYKTALKQASATYTPKSQRCETKLQKCNENYAKQADIVKDVKEKNFMLKSQAEASQARANNLEKIFKDLKDIEGSGRRKKSRRV